MEAAAQSLLAAIAIPLLDRRFFRAELAGGSEAETAAAELEAEEAEGTASTGGNFKHASNELLSPSTRRAPPEDPAGEAAALDAEGEDEGAAIAMAGFPPRAEELDESGGFAGTEPPGPPAQKRLHMVS